jgi:hypothetical protein
MGVLSTRVRHVAHKLSPGFRELGEIRNSTQGEDRTCFATRSWRRNFAIEGPLLLSDKPAELRLASAVFQTLFQTFTFIELNGHKAAD